MILLGLNIGMFFFAKPEPGGLFEKLVLHAETVLGGEIWRLLTACFLHWDTNHLLFNMIGLYFFGTTLEQALGTRRFLTVYLAGGVLASVVYGVRVHDAATFVAVTVVALATALLAAGLPARHAAAVEPVEALRE